MKTFSHLWRYLAKLFLEWEMFQIKVVEKIVTYYTFSDFFTKIVPSWGNVEKCDGAREASDDNMAARCVLDN